MEHQALACGSLALVQTVYSNTYWQNYLALFHILYSSINLVTVFDFRF